MLIKAKTYAGDMQRTHVMTVSPKYLTTCSFFNSRKKNTAGFLYESKEAATAKPGGEARKENGGRKRERKQ